MIGDRRGPPNEFDDLLAHLAHRADELDDARSLPLPPHLLLLREPSEKLRERDPPQAERQRDHPHLSDAPFPLRPLRELLHDLALNRSHALPHARHKAPR